jgi:outer membrane protein assembly factor BamB
MRCLLAILLLSLTTSYVVEKTDAADWPQWRGLNRDGLSSETGLLAVWPAGGPRVLWRATDFGLGWSSLAIANGCVYTQGQRGDHQYVIAFDARAGKKLWETVTTQRYDRQGAHEGPRGTPTVDGDRLYAMAVDGAVVCLEAVTGKTIWSQNVVQKYGGTVIKWGMSESPLIDGERLIVMPGGPGAMVVSLNKLTGALQWKAGSDEAAYSSAMVAGVGAVRQVLALIDVCSAKVGRSIAYRGLSVIRR